MKLQYNRAVGPLGSVDVPSDQTLTLRYGYNGWKGATAVQMQRDTKAQVCFYGGGGVFLLTRGCPQCGQCHALLTQPLLTSVESATHFFPPLSPLSLTAVWPRL